MGERSTPRGMLTTAGWKRIGRGWYDHAGHSITIRRERDDRWHVYPSDPQASYPSLRTALAAAEVVTRYLEGRAEK